MAGRPDILKNQAGCVIGQEGERVDAEAKVGAAHHRTRAHVMDTSAKRSPIWKPWCAGRWPDAPLALAQAARFAEILPLQLPWRGAH